MVYRLADASRIEPVRLLTVLTRRLKIRPGDRNRFDRISCPELPDG